MIPKFNFKLALLCIFVCVISQAHSQFIPVQWEDLKNSQVSSSSLSRTSNKTGSALSKNVLFGRPGKGIEFNDGAIRYTTTINDKGKRLGFSLEESHAFSARDMKYAFYFYKNKKAKVIVNGEVISLHTYNTADEAKIAREGKFIRFYLGGIQVYEVNADPYENLHVQAIMYNGSSDFNNVEVDFPTERFNIKFIVDNVNKKIDYTISGGSSPYRVLWCTGEECSSKFTPQKIGTYTVKIYDALGNIFERMVSIGEDLQWQDFNKTIQNGSTLEKNATNANGWGYARSQFTNQATSYWWVEYTIDIEQNNKFFGVTDESVIIDNLEDLGYGFYITKEEKQKLKIIHNGEIVENKYYRDGDVLRVEYNGGGVRWYQNGILIYQIKGEHVLYSTKISAGVKGAATLEGVRNYSNEPQLVTTNFNEALGLGEVVVNIPSTEVGPFHYFISQDRIIDFDDYYKVLRDSIFDGDLDSMAFYNAGETSNSHTFTGLVPGVYNYAVFNTQGKRIYGNTIDVFSSVEQLSAQGISINSRELISISDNSSIDMKYFLTDEGGANEMDIELRDVRGRLYYGLSDLSIVTSSKSDLFFGFRVKRNKAFVVTDGVESNEFTFVRKNSLLSIKYDDGQMSLLIDGRIIAQRNVQLPFIYKSSIGFNKAGMSVAIKKPFLGKKVLKRKLSIMDASCFGEGGTITIDVIPNNAISNVQYSLINDYTNTSLPLTNTGGLYSLSNIATGVYRLRATYVVNVGFFSYSTFDDDFIAIGNTQSWDYVVNTDIFSNGETLIRNTFAPGTFGSAQIKNNMDPAVTSWVSFKPFKPGAANSSLGIVKWTSLGQQPAGSENSSIHMNIIKISNNVYRVLIMNGNIVTAQRNITPALQTIVEYNPSNGQNTIKFNNQSYSFVSLVGLEKFNVFLQQPGARLFDINTNLKCILPEVYTRLKKSLDGGYYMERNGKVFFEYFEEYNNVSQNLDYSILDDMGFPITGSTPIVIENLGDNRMVLDVTSFSPGFYILEVRNSKGEVSKLRFKVV